MEKLNKGGDYLMSKRDWIVLEKELLIVMDILLILKKLLSL